jgi:hypothetical protein
MGVHPSDTESEAVALWLGTQWPRGRASESRRCSGDGRWAGARVEQIARCESDDVVAAVACIRVPQRSKLSRQCRPAAVGAVTAGRVSESGGLHGEMLRMSWPQGRVSECRRN